MLFKQSRKSLPVLAVAFVGIVASGCSSKPLAPEEQNLYDGKWVAKIGETYPIQYRSGWKLFCANMQGDLSFDVVNGVIKTTLLGDEVQMPLSAGGKFSISEESESTATSTGASTVQLYDGKVTNTLRGKLGGSNAKGRLDNWIQEAVSGCTTSVTFVREGSGGSTGTQAAPSLQPQFDEFSLRAEIYSKLVE